jgi:lipoprotein NlpD
MKKTAFSSSVVRAALAVLALGLAACTSNVPAPVVGRSNGAATQAAQIDTYTVKSGDTLYSIARAHGMDYRDLLALNVSEIQNPDQISVGRVLKVGPRPDLSTSGVVTAPVTSDVVVVRPIGDASAVGRPSGGEGNTESLKREPKAGKEPYSEQALATAQSGGQPAASVAAKPAAPASAGSKGPWIWPANGKIAATFSESGSKGIDIVGKAGDPVIAAGDGRVVYSGTGLRGYGKLVIIKHNDTFLSAYAHNQNILVKEGQSVTQGQRIAEMGNTDADQVKLHFEVRRQGRPVDPLQYLPRR